MIVKITKSSPLILLCLLLGLEASTGSADLWGFFGHKRINRMAVFTLPPEMFGFFKEHIEFLTEHAVDPDKRRYAVEGEAPRHYIDIDHYAHGGNDPFEVVPKQWDDAVEKLSEDTLQAYGIVPWHVDVMVSRLSHAMRTDDTYYILRTAADLGHYVGDAHVPLHTTENYNGQLTGQKGIHGFWESRVPELFADDYDYFVGRAQYVDDVLDYTWNEVEKSHRAVDSVLTFEKKLTEQFASDKKYGIETRGSTTVQTYSRPFSEAYSEMLDGMIERRMRQSIISLGSLWYTAWVDAGQPDLDNLKEAVPSQEQLAEEEELKQQYDQGKIKGREHPH
ncbi:MAG: S1/P1 Nuclease [Flavobacteriales bacterium]|nr:S1/P1 Nuclease [Flavobacteriales bacterium]